jgi:NADH:ubiquinone oxidoreductase subunit 3 (subunit A)
MAGAYLEVVVFAVIALLIPPAMILLSKLLAGNGASELEGKNYESGEENIGDGIHAPREYLHYLFLFLAFAVISIVMIIWAAVAKSLSFLAGLSVLMVAVFGFVLSIFVFEIGKIRR